MKQFFLTILLMLMTLNIVGQEKGMYLGGITTDKVMDKVGITDMDAIFMLYEKESSIVFSGKHKKMSFTKKNIHIKRFMEVQPDGTIMKGYDIELEDGTKLFYIVGLGVLRDSKEYPEAFFFQSSAIPGFQTK